MDIVDRLSTIQKQERITDTELAQRLGLHRVSWQKIKHRKVNYGRKFLSAVKALYPALFLSDNATDCSRQPSPTARPALFRRLLDKFHPKAQKET